MRSSCLQDLTHNARKVAIGARFAEDGEDDRASRTIRITCDSRSAAGHRHGGTELYDAIYLASNELMKKQPGRKAVIILSDGVDRGSKTTLESAIEAAQRSETIVYSIYFKGHETSTIAGQRWLSGPWRRLSGGAAVTRAEVVAVRRRRWLSGRRTASGGQTAAFRRAARRWEENSGAHFEGNGRALL